ncbi:MAG TPA: SGNH/GDSL hydrolase family protein [Methylomirabilota bacterium]|nr:SGNH/GDSL hydrolase family protein [Methylomirabilota bacterium]
MVPPHAGRRRALSALLLAAGLAAGCAGGRVEAARTLPGDASVPLLYVALGDSTVEGIGATSAATTYVGQLHRRLRAIYPEARVVNLGVGGATSADVLARQLERAVALGPQLVTLSVGPNDITTHVPLAQYERNVTTILDRLVTGTPAVVVVNLLPDLVVTPRFRNHEAKPAISTLTVAFNEALERQGRRHGAELVDLYHPSREEVPAQPELIWRDGYHPSDAGYARWAELMWAGIEARIASR